MKRVFQFLLLVLFINAARYVYAFLPVEQMIFGPLMSSISASPSYFNNDFSTTDWVSSYFYNFMLWFTVTLVYVLLEPRLTGHPVIRSLKVYGIAFLFFASISAIYMNHYSHPKDFYLWNIADALVVMPFVAVINGLLAPIVLRPKTPQSSMR